MSLVALQHIWSSQTRDGTRVHCIDRRILNHQTTREVQKALNAVVAGDIWASSPGVARLPKDLVHPRWAEHHLFPSPASTSPWRSFQGPSSPGLPIPPLPLLTQNGAHLSFRALEKAPRLSPWTWGSPQTVATIQPHSFLLVGLSQWGTVATPGNPSSPGITHTHTHTHIHTHTHTHSEWSLENRNLSPSCTGLASSQLTHKHTTWDYGHPGTLHPHEWSRHNAIRPNSVTQNQYTQPPSTYSQIRVPGTRAHRNHPPHPGTHTHTHTHTQQREEEHQRWTSQLPRNQHSHNWPNTHTGPQHKKYINPTALAHSSCTQIHTHRDL